MQRRGQSSDSPAQPRRRAANPAIDVLEADGLLTDEQVFDTNGQAVTALTTEEQS